MEGWFINPTFPGQGTANMWGNPSTLFSVFKLLISKSTYVCTHQYDKNPKTLPTDFFPWFTIRLKTLNN